jgi:hypothetical protein
MGQGQRSGVSSFWEGEINMDILVLLPNQVCSRDTVQRTLCSCEMVLVLILDLLCAVGGHALRVDELLVFACVCSSGWRAMSKPQSIRHISI